MIVNAVPGEGEPFEIFVYNEAVETDPAGSSGHNPQILSDMKLITEFKVLDVTEGLAYLHSLTPRVCHGDLKPVSTLKCLLLSIRTHKQLR